MNAEVQRCSEKQNRGFSFPLDCVACVVSIKPAQLTERQGFFFASLRLCIHFVFVLLLSFLAASTVCAEVLIPELKSRVTDQTATLTPDTIARLETTLAQFEQAKGSQIAVLIVPTTQPEDIAQFGIRLAEQWKIGREKVDDGAILIVAKDDRRVRIEVGYGLEGVIPDAIAKRIIEEDITPRFKQGDFSGGVEAGVSRMMRLIEGEPLPPLKQDMAFKLSEFAQFGLIMVWLLGTMVGLILGATVGVLPALSSAVVSGVLGGLIAGVASVGFIVGAAVVVAMIFFAGKFNGTGGGGWSSGGGSDWSGGGGFGGGGGGFGGGGSSGSW